MRQDAKEGMIPSAPEEEEEGQTLSACCLPTAGLHQATALPVGPATWDRQHHTGAQCSEEPPPYAGHCPHYKFALGQTYGKLTSQQLTGPEGACHGQRLLQPNWCPRAHLDLPEEGVGEGHGANASLFSCCTIPGYTGFIPRAQHYFAKTYSQICKEAGQEFARQLVRGAGGRQARPVALTPQDVTPEVDLPPGEEKPRLAASPRGPSCASKPHPAPAAVEDGGPQKYFISGFTGFVPRARYLIGASYPTLSRQAWAEFRQTLRKHQQEASLEGGAHRRSDGRALPPLVVKTYPTDKGLLPHYQGYVPGYKFRFGRTYGHLTYDALGRSTPEEKLTPGHLP
ncbi:PREDICTED: protein FAM166B [Gekko japonicus]|uniref:Ciliary microtubule inner protein 2B n=1 Tax=Gekko japonicus TaxID=146911 RepID=A0ABM1JHT4_GEKJA|nr:PREDICTED: protein FAM166B [Gekko japonicus]